MDNTSVQVVSTLVASLKSFVEVKLVMIEIEIRYRLNIKNIHTRDKREEIIFANLAL